MHLRRSDNCDKGEPPRRPPRLVLAVGLVTLVVASLLHKIRHLPDFAAIRDLHRRPGANAKIHNKHLGATEAYVDGLVEAIGDKDYCGRVRGVRDEVGHEPSFSVDAGYFIAGQARRPS